MKIVSWNVAGLRACLKKGFMAFFNKINADIFCIQESKITKEELNFQPEGYEIYVNSATKKGYAGTIIYTKIHPLSVKYGMGIIEHDQEGRMITLEFPNYYLINVYVPNAKRELLRLDYRLKWEDDFLAYILKLEQQKPVLFCGDLNVCHQEIDIKNPKANIRSAGFTIEEREKFSNLLKHDFIDTYRYQNPNKVIYTWWSYFRNARERNIGWRLDYIVISKKLLPNMREAYIYNAILGSDHCPIGLEMEIGK
ncbi:MAG: exodeoxyribonuclease III [Bacilli bacterium]|jgi:exodeoxyribonuclease-3|nr:exodeoxyribonuclease III [Bacilli bacterium]